MIKTILGLTAALAVSASPIERSGVYTVPLKFVAVNTTASNLLKNAQARLDKANGVSDARVGNSDAVKSGSITNIDESYVASMTVGSGTYSLIVDTGSSNTWVGAQSAYDPSSASQDTGDSVSVSYGSGSFSGEEYLDTVSFAGLSVKKQSIGAASYSQGFSGVDGIFGVGPVDLTEDTVSNTNTVPTFLDNLYSQGSISTEVLGVYFKPESGSDTNDANGELTLGGTDSSKYSGSLTYFSTLKSGSASPYWGIDVSKFAYGSTSLGSATSSAIVDTGTTLILIPTTAYNKFLSASGGSTDSSSGLASWTTKPTGNFAITFGSTAYTLTPSQYLIPSAQYSYYGLSSGKYYSYISNSGSSSSSTVDAIIGQKFLENYYSVFDTTNSRIGFATRA